MGGIMGVHDMVMGVQTSHAWNLGGTWAAVVARMNGGAEENEHTCLIPFSDWDS